MTRNANVITVPNNKLAESFIINYSTPTEEMGVSLRAGVSLGANLQSVEAIALDVATVIQDDHFANGQSFKPLFTYERFASNAAEFTLTLRAHNYDACSELVSALIKALDTRFREEGIDFAIPATQVNLRRTDS